jgi:hypothetical protein
VRNFVTVEYFIITEEQLRAIYDAIAWGRNSKDSLRVIMLLSHPIIERPDEAEIYEDCFLLGLEGDVIDTLVEVAQGATFENDGLTALVRNSLIPGRAAREEDS